MPFVHLRMHTEFSVVDGTLRTDDAADAAAANGQVAAAIMRPIRTSCQVDDALPGVVEILREQGLPLLPVLENERVCGLITPDNTAEYIALRRAVRNRLAELPAARVREG